VKPIRCARNTTCASTLPLHYRMSLGLLFQGLMGSDRAGVATCKPQMMAYRDAFSRRVCDPWLKELSRSVVDRGALSDNTYRDPRRSKRKESSRTIGSSALLQQHCVSKGAWVATSRLGLFQPTLLAHAYSTFRLVGCIRFQQPFTAVLIFSCVYKPRRSLPDLTSRIIPSPPCRRCVHLPKTGVSGHKDIRGSALVDTK